MPSVFPPWSNGVFRGALGVAAFGVVAVVLAPMVWVRSPARRNEFLPVDQPVEFDHRHHVADEGIDCRYCHNTPDRAPTAGMPSTDKCMGCHAQIWNQSIMTDPIRRSYFSGQPIPWNRVYQLPDFVFFNHEAHVTHGVGCSTCHGRVDRMPRVYQVVSLTMGWCLDCHRDPAKHLRPLDEITDMRWLPEEHPAEAEATARALHVRSLTNCTTCHR
ncbi:MAG TPA: cytochrome c3 family protein [Minicystis sp.]|nr:cytochrome c3 family protein [Minicystis sp.]